MGKVIFWVGIIGVIISLLMLLVGWLFPFFIGLFFLGFPILILSLSVAALGLIIWLCAGDGKKKQIGGLVLLLVGSIGFLIAYLLFEAGANSYEDIEQYGLPILGLWVGGISFIFLMMGIILFVVGRSQAQKHNLATLSFKKTMAGLLIIVIICISVYFVTSPAHKYYYWSSGGTSNTTAPPITATPLPTPTPVTYTLTVVNENCCQEYLARGEVCPEYMWNCGTGGTVSPNEGTYQPGTLPGMFVTLTATFASGKNSVYWNISDASGNRYSSSPTLTFYLDSDTTVYVHFY